MSGRFLIGSGGVKKALPVTNLVSALTGSGYSVTLTWTPPNAAVHDQIVVERSIDGGGYSVVATLANSSSTYTESPGFSIDATYRVKATKAAGVDSDYVTATTRRTLPAAPSINSLYRVGNDGTIVLDANSPGHAKISRFDVGLSTNDGGSYGSYDADSGADPDHVWYSVVPHNAVCRARIRTVDTLAQVSAWVTSGQLVNVNDTTGPALGTLSVTASGRGALINFAAPTDASGVSATYLQIDTGGGWATIANFGTGGASNWYMNFASGDRGKLVNFRLYSVDIYGNATTGSTVQFQTAPQGTFYAFPSESATYETAGTPTWRSDTDDVISGFFDGTYGTQAGAWFYGTAFADICKGHTPDTVRLFMIRNGSDGSTGNNVIQMHTNTSKPGGDVSLTGASDNGPLLAGSNASADHVLPGGWYTAIGNGTARGISTRDPGSYRRLQGRAKNAYSGLVTIIFN